MRAESNGMRSPYKSRLMVGAAGLAAMASTTAAFADGAPPPAAPDKWLPFAELGAGSDNHSAIGGVNFFAPLSQTNNDLLFARFGVQTRFKSDNIESLSLGYRTKKENNWILGGYVGLDRTETEAGTTFGQFSFGVEALSTEWDAHLNAYLADQKISQIGAFKLDIHDTFIGIDQKQEAALSGFDGEVGYRIMHGDGPDVRLYAGAYSFRVNDKSAFPTKDMTGPKAGVEVSLYDLDFIGPQSRFSATAEVRDDALRGTTEFFGASLRIPLGGEGAQALDELDRRMVDSPRRHDGVITSGQFNKSEPVIIYNGTITSEPTNTLLYVDNTAGEGDFHDPTTLTDATTRPGPNQFIVLTDNDGSTIHTGGATIRSGETVVGGGHTFTVRGVNSGATFDHVFGPGVGPLSLDNPGGVVVNLQSNTTIYGVTIAGSFTDAIYGHNIDNVVIDHVTIDGSGGGANGVHLVQDAPGGSHVTISNSSIADVTHDGVYIENTFTTGVSNQVIHLDHTSISGAGNNGFYSTSAVSGGANASVDVELTSSPIAGSGAADVLLSMSVAAGSTGTQNVVVDPTLISGGTYGVLIDAHVDGGTLNQNITLADLDFTGQTVAGIAIYAYGENGGTLNQTVNISNVTVTGSDFPIGLIADAATGAHVTQNFALTNVSATGGTYDNIQIIGHADGAGSVLHQDGTLVHVTSTDSAGGTGVYIYGEATAGGLVIQHFGIADLDAHNNYVGGFYAGIAASSGTTDQSIAAQYVQVVDSDVSNNFVGLSVLAQGLGNAVARQDLFVGNTVLSNASGAGYQATGGAVNALTFDGGSVQQYAFFAGDTASNNIANGIAINATSLYSGFAAQTVLIYGTPAHMSNLGHNGGYGVLVNANALFGGDVEQNVSVYYANMNHNGAGGMSVVTDSYGIAAGYALYYSHVSQNIYAVGNSIDSNTGNGFSVFNYATYGAGIDQVIYVGGSTTAHNTGDGIHIESHDVGASVYGYAPGTHLYSDVYIYGGTADHNGGNGISVVSDVQMPLDSTKAFGYSYLQQHVVIRDTSASNNTGSGLVENANATGIFSLNLQYVTLVNDTFSGNKQDGATFTATQYYGPYSFGAVLQQVTVTGGHFDNNRGDGIHASLDASGFEGRVEQDFSIFYATMDNNRGDGISLYRHSHDGAYYPGYTCNYIQGTIGGCSIVRQTVVIGYSDISGNRGDGIYLGTRADTYASVYSRAGRPLYQSTFLIEDTTVTGNRGDGLRIYNYAANNSYVYQYIVSLDTNFDGNRGTGVSSLSNVTGDSTLVQKFVFYGLGTGGGSTVSNNRGDGIAISSETTDGGRIGNSILIGYSYVDGNRGNGVNVSGASYDVANATPSTGVSQYLTVLASDISNNHSYGIDLHQRVIGSGAIGYQYLGMLGANVSNNLNDGVHVFEIGYNHANVAQGLYFAFNQITGNHGDGIYSVGIAVDQSFATQRLVFGEYLSPVTNVITGNRGDGIYAGVAAFSAGAAEQNLFLYGVNASSNRGDGIGLGASANGYGFGPAYIYYSHVEQNLVSSDSTFNGNHQNGVSVSNVAYYGGQIDQSVQVIYSDLSNNRGSGFYETSHLTSIRGNSFAFGTNINADVYLVGDTITHNGGNGIDLRSYNNGPAYAPAFFGGYSYLTQHIQVAGSTVDRNQGAGLVLDANQIGRYALNAQYLTLAGSTFNKNGGDGARILSNSYYGPGGFGDTFEQITIQGSDFIGNGGNGLRLAADASGLQGRAEQHATISGSRFNQNGYDGISIYASARNGTYIATHPCDTAQGLPGGCAFVRQDVRVQYSDISKNAGDGVSVTTYADNYGAIYGASGRPHAPTLLLYGTTVNNNGNRGLNVSNNVTGNSYLYQYIATIDSTFNNNNADGVYLSSYVAGASTMLQRALVYSYATGASARGNGGNGFKATIEALGGSYARDVNIVQGVNLNNNGSFGFDAAVAYADGSSTGLQINAVYYNSLNHNGDGAGFYSIGAGAQQISYFGGNQVHGNAFVGVYGEANFGAFQYIGVYSFGNDVAFNGTDYLFNSFGGSTQILN